MCAADLLMPERITSAHEAHARSAAGDDGRRQRDRDPRRARATDRIDGSALRALNITDDPDVGGLVMNVHDITDRQRAEDELTHLAFHDTLTGLPNRALFNDRIDHAMRRNQRTGYDVAVVYLDLDGFKTVNDSLGHDVGDDVLRQVAARLSSAVRPADTVARLGGDEFAILIEAAEQPLEQAIGGRRSCAAGDGSADARSATTRWCCRRASASPSATDVDQLVDAPRRRHRDVPGEAEREGQVGVVRRRRCAPSVVERHATRDRPGPCGGRRAQFEVVYQPIVRLASGEVAGFEALLRWHHPTRGLDHARRVRADRRGDGCHRADRRVGARSGVRAPHRPGSGSVPSGRHPSRSTCRLAR